MSIDLQEGLKVACVCVRRGTGHAVLSSGTGCLRHGSEVQVTREVLPGDDQVRCDEREEAAAMHDGVKRNIPEELSVQAAHQLGEEVGAAHLLEDLALVERDGLRVLPYAHERETQGRLLAQDEAVVARQRRSEDPKADKVQQQRPEHHKGEQLGRDVHEDHRLGEDQDYRLQHRCHQIQDGESEFAAVLRDALVRVVNPAAVKLEPVVPGDSS